MGKGSGSTRSSSSGSPRGLQNTITNARGEGVNIAEEQLRANADSAMSAIRKMKSPSFGSPSSIELPGGYIAEITMKRPAYGSGGLVESEIWTPTGERVGGIANHRERFGSNGMATFGTKAEALRSVKESMTDWIRIRFKGDRY